MFNCYVIRVFSSSFCLLKLLNIDLIFKVTFRRLEEYGFFKRYMAHSDNLVVNNDNYDNLDYYIIIIDMIV